jgi:hypothetical protein
VCVSFRRILELERETVALKLRLELQSTAPVLSGEWLLVLLFFLFGSFLSGCYRFPFSFFPGVIQSMTVEERMQSMDDDSWLMDCRNYTTTTECNFQKGCSV